MKRLFALLLVVIMVVSLVACKKPVDPNPTGTTAGNGNTSFAGKTLQIWGLGDGKTTYTDWEKFGKGNYLWMMKAAILDWAALNGVTIEFVANYNQNQILAAMNSGSKPDLLYTSNQFPAAANYGILAEYTKEEYDALAEVFDHRYLDLMETKGKVYGWIVPWVGDYMVYYNKSMFDRYGLKTPTEHVMEGTWTISVYKQMMEDLTKDLDGDGKMDTLGHDTYTAGLPYLGINLQYAENEKGELTTDFINSTYCMEQLEFMWEMQYQKGCIATGTGNITSNITYPMFGLQISDAEPYNFEHCFRTIPNEDVLEVVPIPAYDGKDTDYAGKGGMRRLTQSFVSMLSSCDEREACMDLQLYLAKCGLKYQSDFSLGAVKCDYPGIQGASEYSKTWTEKFKAVCDQRAEDIKKCDFNQELVDKYYEYFEKCEIWVTGRKYADVTSLFTHADFKKMAPASAFPTASEKFEADILKYNDLYVY